MNLLQKAGLLIAGFALAVVAFIGVNAAFAQDGEGEADAPTITQEDGEGVAGRFGPRFHFGENEEALAEALGITVEELQAAREEVRQAMIDQAVSEGRITEEQASLLEARQALRDYVDQDEILERVIGMSREQFQAALQAEADAALQQAVTDGVITQEQADQIGEAPGVWGGRGHGRHFRGLLGVGGD